jgi:hypothetical protein
MRVCLERAVRMRKSYIEFDSTLCIVLALGMKTIPHIAHIKIRPLVPG